MTYILGLTGGIASGKSTVSAYLAQNGALIIDADLIARQVVAKKSSGLKQIVAKFGGEILTASGELDRKKLGKLVFSNKDLLKNLTDITGPLIRAEILREIEAAKKAQVKLVVLDIPLLFETGYQTLCDKVMVVTIPSKLQLERVMKRDNLSAAEARKRIANQLPASKRNELADVLIDNSKSVAETYQQVLKWLKIEALC
ncbi:dephospho-CoA kinase [Ligilactobacillus agilis]|uniref:Dephospho-CoA kinase n=1 Tax=Ligilactobacillus agilis TaxID=1601 RepID=A0A6F9Y598_9LACO|nr:dephospho-CoA kinase [Ligilactobacillus agilis]MCL8203830.1 dephospho-CoA kinase [Ligilactobacillus agilis]OXS50433.1 dephospho-CoA kinase [Ligilactobacillus agilis]GET11357.1 dephospho-CoA kinase [Ligilactobacillus agilis]GET12627.1 dephospho-CoA kinase [Ligilactobacillus agilis]GET14301.1 dephospho-CoA kinase [Ligilactobacillus agilis]